MVAKKRKSKRTTLQQKYKIQKRTKEHHKRIKKNAITTLRKKKVDNTIPNAWPHKEELLGQIKAAKEKMELVRLQQKEKRKLELQKRRAGATAIKEDDMDEESGDDEEDPFERQLQERRKKNLLNLSGINGNYNEDGMNDGEEQEQYEYEISVGQNSRRAFLKELRKTVEGSDVILQVLDARDPIGTTSTAVQEMVSAKDNKKLVYVLNKSDLVPSAVLAGWLKYLRRNYPAVPFKCNTQQGQTRNLGRKSGKVGKYDDASLKTNQAVGAEELLGLLKNYCRVGDSKSSIVVGVVGFPNVGKSSLINSLMRARAVGVSSMPGFTKKCQEVILDKHIRLMDSPGVVFADGDTAATALRNCVNVEELDDVMTPIAAILDRCPAGYLMQLYNIKTFKNGDATAFLALVAKSTGKLKKGGIPNIDSAARVVLHDWNSGKIRYYCRPPALAQSQRSDEEEGDSMILNDFSSVTDNIKGLDEGDIRVLNQLESQHEQNNGEAGVSEFIGMEQVAPSVQQFDESFSNDDGNLKMSATESSSAKKSSTKSKSTKLNSLSLSNGDDNEQEEDEEEEEEEEEEEDQNMEGEDIFAEVDKIEKRKAGSLRASKARFAKAVEEPAVDPRKANKAASKKGKKDARRREKYDFNEHF
jgi:nuclear GTP-binding protein